MPTVLPDQQFAFFGLVVLEILKTNTPPHAQPWKQCPARWGRCTRIRLPNAQARSVLASVGRARGATRECGLQEQRCHWATLEGLNQNSPGTTLLHSGLQARRLLGTSDSALSQQCGGPRPSPGTPTAVPGWKPGTTSPSSSKKRLGPPLTGRPHGSPGSASTQGTTNTANPSSEAGHTANTLLPGPLQPHHSIATGPNLRTGLQRAGGLWRPSPMNPNSKASPRDQHARFRQRQNASWAW